MQVQQRQETTRTAGNKKQMNLYCSTQGFVAFGLLFFLSPVLKLRFLSKTVTEVNVRGEV